MRVADRRSDPLCPLLSSPRLQTRQINSTLLPAKQKDYPVVVGLLKGVRTGGKQPSSILYSYETSHTHTHTHQQNVTDKCHSECSRGTIPANAAAVVELPGWELNSPVLRLHLPARLGLSSPDSPLSSIDSSPCCIDAAAWVGGVCACVCHTGEM